MDRNAANHAEKHASYLYGDALQKKNSITPQQLLVHDVRIEDWRPDSKPSLEVRERVATELVPQSAAIAVSHRLLKAAEAASNPIEYQRLAGLEEKWGWLSHLRLKKLQGKAYDPSDSPNSAMLRWIHVSNKFPKIFKFLWALSSSKTPKRTAAALRLLDQCLQKQERYSKHGKHFAPFFQSLQQDSGHAHGYPYLISVPFLDWSVSDQTPPLRFQIDKREGYTSSRSSSHLLRSLLQYFYRLEETRDREKDQVFSKHQPWTSDRELDLRIRRWYGRHPTALVVDELWILAIDEHHVITFSSNQSWKSSRAPSTRLVMDLLQVQEELNIIVKLTEQQFELIQTVSNATKMFFHADDVYPPIPAFAGLLEVGTGLSETLHRELLDLRELLESTNTLVTRTVQLVNIRLEDHGKAILVFTIVTMVVLPLNFVSSFFGMNVSDIRNMSSSQSLFWLVACCVTAGVVALSVFVAFSGGKIMERILQWKETRQRTRWRSTGSHTEPLQPKKGFRVLDIDSWRS